MRNWGLVSALIFLLLPNYVVFDQPVKVPILMYHRVGNRFNTSCCDISLKEFTRQMDYLKANNYETVGIDQIAAALRGGAKLPPKSVALTFDDGYKCGITRILPILKSRGFRGTFFIIVGYANGHPSYLSWSEIKKLRDSGMWIGAHTVSHPDLRRLDVDALKREIIGSKRFIERRMEKTITVFAYPYGEYNPQAIRVVQGAGYTAALAIDKPGISHYSDTIYRLNRIPIYPKMTMKRFIAALEGK